MKNKYERMNKEEKRACRKKYYNTAKGKEMKMRFIRLYILGIIGLLFSSFLVVSGYLSHQLDWATCSMAIILTIFSCTYIIGAFLLSKKCYNDFAVKKMK